MGLVPLEGGVDRGISLSPSTHQRRPCENREGKQPSASHKVDLQQELNIPAPWSWTSQSLQLWGMNICCLSHWICGVLLKQPELTKTSYFRVASPLQIFLKGSLFTQAGGSHEASERFSVLQMGLGTSRAGCLCGKQRTDLPPPSRRRGRMRMHPLSTSPHCESRGCSQGSAFLFWMLCFDGVVPIWSPTCKYIQGKKKTSKWNRSWGRQPREEEMGNTALLPDSRSGDLL